MQVSAIRRLAGRLGISPRGQSALCGFLVGAVMSLVLIALPLWLAGGAPATSAAGAVPLAALSTPPPLSPQFDISAILVGEWSGEMCPDNGDPIPVTFEFIPNDHGGINYSLLAAGDFRTGEIIGSGACDVDGEELAFHTFLAILNDCDEACGVDRAYVGHFEDGALVGRYDDAVADELCSSCFGGGSWWLTPEQPDL
jgi:hypothetical protein